MIAPSLLKLALPAIGGALLVWLVIDHGRLADVEDAQRACVAAIKAADAPLSPCPDVVGAAATAARMAASCDAALGTGKLYAIRASCGRHTKAVHAQLSASTTETGNLRAELAGQRAAADAAVARAEARGAIQTNRGIDNERTIQAAPRGADGTVLCDAGCVRRIAGTAASAGR